MADAGASFTLEESIRAQRAMRDRLGLGDEAFPVPAFVGMVSDEIEKLRAAGETDEGIAEIVREATGKPITADDIAESYATPQERSALKG